MKINTADFDVQEELQGPLPRAVLFHDLSGFGKCSITTGLPILSAAGIEGVAAPTAVLSTHTGGFEGYTFRDLTEDLPDFLNHWNDLDIHFDTIYSGYLGSPEQAGILEEFIKVQKEKNPEILTFIDPVMGDNGELYPNFGDDMVAAMRGLAASADVMLPNMTEATQILNKPYQPGPYSEDYIREIAEGIASLGPKKVVITGMETGKDTLATAIYDEGKLDIVENPLIPGQFHGTGDVFAGFALAGLMNGLSLKDATELAAWLTYGAVKRTAMRETPRRDGVDFEGMLPVMMKNLSLTD